MIKVEKLSKRYGATTAVQELSFEVPKGEVVGFLGPNGAGKTTTMRILTGYMPATDGVARVAGFDVHTHSLDARRHIATTNFSPRLKRPRCSGLAFFRDSAKSV